MIRDFTDKPGGFPAGDPALIDWLDVFNMLGFDDPALRESVAAKQGSRSDQSDESRIARQTMLAASLIHGELVQYKEFKKILDASDKGYVGIIETLFFQEMVTYDSYEEFSVEFNKKKDAEFALAGKIAYDVIELEESDPDLDRSKWGDYGYKSKELSRYLDQRENAQEKSEIERIHRDLVKSDGINEYKRKLNEERRNVLDAARKIFELALCPNKHAKALQQFVRYKQAMMVPGPVSKVSWFWPYNLQKNIGGFLDRFDKAFKSLKGALNGTVAPEEKDDDTQTVEQYQDIIFMNQWLFAMQMSETIRKIHAQGGEILFELGVGMFSNGLEAISYLLSLGFDGVKIVVEKLKDTKSCDFEKSISLDSFKLFEEGIRVISPRAKVYISVPAIKYLKKLKQSLTELRHSSTSTNPVNFCIARTLSTIGSADKKLDEDVLLEMDVNPADRELHDAMLSMASSFVGVRELAVPGSKAKSASTKPRQDVQSRSGS
jgi:hypothetical protein